MSDELAHYGVKGMRWGHRKTKSQRQPEIPKAARDPEDSHADHSC